jgi:hypothetical protein
VYKPRLNVIDAGGLQCRFVDGGDGVLKGVAG